MLRFTRLSLALLLGMGNSVVKIARGQIVAK
jgi:hypothetical protein